MVGGDRLIDEHIARLGFRLGKLPFEIRDHAVGELAGTLIFAAPLRLHQLVAGRFEPLFELLRRTELVLLGPPAPRQRRRFLLVVGEFRLELAQPLMRSRIFFLFQGFLLDLQLDDAAVDLVQFLGLRIDLHAQPRGRLVDEVDRLVRQEPVGDVAVRQRRGGDYRRIGDPDAVV